MSRFTHRIRTSIGVLSATAIVALASCDHGGIIDDQFIELRGTVYGTVMVDGVPIDGQSVTLAMRDSVCSRFYGNLSSSPTDKAGNYRRSISRSYDPTKVFRFCVTASSRTINGDSATAVGILPLRFNPPYDSIRLDLHIRTSD